MGKFNKQNRISLKAELPLFLLIAFPLIYLYLVWKDLPQEVPIHWNIYGQPDNWTDRSGLLIVVSAILLCSYILFFILQIVLRQNWAMKMGRKFYWVRFSFMLFISFICAFVINSALNKNANFNFVLLLIGFLLVMLGNFMHSIKPNYFLGIRTPWTLKNDFVWNKTHRLTSKLWFYSGIVIILLNLINQSNNSIYVFTLIAIISLIPICYSYIIYRKLKTSSHK